MADTQTPVYLLTQPEVGASTGTWGGKLNTDLLTLDGAIARPQIPFNAPAVAGVTTLDLSLARAFAFTVSQATTLAFANVPSNAWFVRVVLQITNGAAFTLTWPASVIFPNGTPPSLQASGVDVIELETVDGGVSWHPVGTPNAEYVVRVGFNTGPQAIPGGLVETAIVWDTAVDNPSGMWSAGQPTRLVAPVAGRYAVAAQAAYPAGCQIAIKKNGTTDVASNNPNASSATTFPINDLVKLAAGDYLEITISAVSGQNLTTGLGTRAAMWRVGP